MTSKLVELQIPSLFGQLFNSFDFLQQVYTLQLAEQFKPKADEAWARYTQQPVGFEKSLITKITIN